MGKLPTHYDNLKVARNAPTEVIHAAYKALALKHHPDRNSASADSNRIMKIINAAHDTLTDPQKRAEYDLWIQQQEQQQARPSTPKKPHSAGTRTARTSPVKNEAEPDSAPTPRASSSKSRLEKYILLLLLALTATGGYMEARRYMKRHPTVKVSTVRMNMKGAAQAQGITSQTLGCVFTAAKTYAVPSAILLGIMEIENGRVGQAAPSADNSYDLGPMKINTYWVPELAESWKTSEEKAQHMLRYDACINIGVGAWILQTKIKETGTLQGGIELFRSAARSMEPEYEDMRYRRKVMAAAEKYKPLRKPR